MLAAMRNINSCRRFVIYKELQRRDEYLRRKFMGKAFLQCCRTIRTDVAWSRLSSHCVMKNTTSFFLSSSCWDSNYGGIYCVQRHYYHCQTPNQSSKKSAADIFVERAPFFLQPYLKLMRLDKPTGTWLLLWPCFWSIGLAAESGHLPNFYYIVLFGLGAVLMRGAGCTINDMWDKDIDKQVERTKLRPLSTGELERSDALGFLAIQLTLADFLLMQLNWYSIVLGTCAIAPVVFYPLAKRFTYWPQLVLGFTFNWGAMLGWASVHGSLYWPVVLPLYLAGISWTMVYDTIYAHQDKVDDVSVGIKSTALKFGANTKKWLCVFSTSMIGNLLLVGATSSQTLPYYLSVGFIGVHLFRQVWKLNINDSWDCFRKFQSNSIIGFILFTGIMCGTLFKSS